MAIKPYNHHDREIKTSENSEKNLHLGGVCVVKYEVLSPWEYASGFHFLSPALRKKGISTISLVVFPIS